MMDERVERLLSEKAGVPWEMPSAGLRARTVAAIANTRPMPLFMQKRIWVPLAAAASVVVATGGMLLIRGEPVGQTQAVSEVRLDPGSMLPPALARLTLSAENSLAAEAKGILEDTKGLGRRVLAQLPFTGGR